MYMFIVQGWHEQPVDHGALRGCGCLRTGCAWRLGLTHSQPSLELVRGQQPPDGLGDSRRREGLRNVMGGAQTLR